MILMNICAEYNHRGNLESECKHSAQQNRYQCCTAGIVQAKIQWSHDADQRLNGDQQCEPEMVSMNSNEVCVSLQTFHSA